ncbi:Yip1 family protein [Bacillus paranthracis]|uniref:Yip1 family protein n=1 Tax=Bacillus paranthracis TaxID=2026186 RepID=A0AAJ1NEY6_9BACI|nr:Yip1 family protein [Bacillus paranthracis]MDG0949897.1 Yip1 family protein [Bacillus paranthracis]MDG0955680.1 Yip1 family protein [Bacillus paranthracis]
MEANMNTQEVDAKKPSLFGMITSPGVQFEGMKTKKKVWGMFFFMALLQGLIGGLSAYVIHTSHEMLKMKRELGELAGQSSLTSEVISGIGSSFVGVMVGTLFITAIYKMFMMFFGNDTPYKTLLNIVVYTNIVLIIGGLMNTILSLIFGTGMTQYTSLGLLFMEGTFAYGIGNTIEVFYVWNLVLIWLGLHITAGLSKVKALIPIIILFIIKAFFLSAIIVLLAKFLPGMPM